MDGNKRKKAAALAVVLFVLVFAFWYGGSFESSRGFSVSESGTNSRQMEQTDIKENEAEKNGQQNVDSQREKSTVNEEDDGNFFQRIVMNIKEKKSSGTASKTQNNKKAQVNANRAAKKSRQEKKSSGKNQPNKKMAEQEVDEGKSFKADAGGTTPKNDTNDNGKNYPQINFNKDADEQSDKDSRDTAQQPGDKDEDTITCTIDISCAVLLEHMDTLKESKKKIVPADGVILPAVVVRVKKGSTVFDVLKTAAKAKNIHLEYNYTPFYKSYYVEGIHNLYQFDAGDLSGWMYSVNGDFPGCGCSEYTVGEGDVIRWLYTCNLGKDVGGYFEE